MTKRGLCLVLLLAIVLLPSIGLTEDEDTMMLAKTLYTLGKGQSYETQLLIGTVVMNRVDSVWFPDTIQDVLNQPHQFARGTRYDEQSLRAARAVMMGRRTAPQSVLYLNEVGVEGEWSAQDLYTTSGRYGFYLSEGA